MHQETEMQNDEISIAEMIQKLKSIWSYLLSQWMKICIVGIMGALIGLGYAWMQPVKYVAKLTFVLEDGKGGVGGLASLAGQFGIDMGGAGGGSVFSGDNILLFLKSESLIRETLFTPYVAKAQIRLVDKYAEAKSLKKGWTKNEKIGPIDFSQLSLDKLPRKEDSLLQTITEAIIKDDLSVVKPDKKASFIEVKVTMRDEWLSKIFAERLVDIATKRYISSKTKTKVANVQKLQDKADSLVALLNNRTYTAASTQQQLVDINPALRTAPIAAEISSRDKTIAATLYAEVVKNLELSRTLLNQETPVIEMVDQSSLPLEKVKVGKLKSLIIGGMVAGMLMVFYLLVARWLKTQLSNIV
jgi:hypothetical protein